jgi:hypothetical protein
MTLTSYRNALAGVFGLTVATVWGFAAWLQPADGDLARVGGYAENDFHWKGPQAVFPANLLHVATDLSEYDRYYDVVILGDSFSCDQESRMFGWQNYFIARTGLSVIVLDIRKFWPQEILALPAFQKYPPKVFVFESVERYLFGRVGYFARTQPPKSSSRIPNPVPLSPVRNPAPIALREEIPMPASDLDPDHVLGYFSALVKRRLGLNELVISLPLAKSGLFTSSDDRDLLVYFDEFDKNKLGEPDFETLRSGIGGFRDLVESNGTTRFVLLVAPDKSSLYGPYLKDAARATANLIAQAAKDPTLPVVRTDEILSAAVASGTPDIYLPNDSHWGSKAHRLIADSLADFLAK